MSFSVLNIKIILRKIVLLIKQRRNKKYNLKCISAKTWGIYPTFFHPIYWLEDSRLSKKLGIHLLCIVEVAKIFADLPLSMSVYQGFSMSNFNEWLPLEQVFPGAWTAILVYLDNAGIWNLRAQNLDSWYLGQEVYLSVVNPETDQNELPLPENTIYCGALSSLQK